MRGRAFLQQNIKWLTAAGLALVLLLSSAACGVRPDPDTSSIENEGSRGHSGDAEDSGQESYSEDNTEVADPSRTPGSETDPVDTITPGESDNSNSENPDETNPSASDDPGSSDSPDDLPPTAPSQPTEPFVEPSEVPIPEALYPETGIVTDCLSYCVIDDEGTVWLAKNAGRHLPMASTTKVMTALITAECVKDPDEKVTISEAAVRDVDVLSSGCTPSLYPGEVLSVRELLYILELPSTNTAGNALAEYIGGTREAFFGLMNKKCTALGLGNTHFDNAHGLDGETHYSCAYDLAVILKAALREPLVREVIGTVEHDVPATAYSESRHLRNGHRILNGEVVNRGAYAGKNGWTYRAQGTLVTAYERGGKRFYIAVMGSDEGLHYLDTANLAEMAYALAEGRYKPGAGTSSGSAEEAAGNSNQDSVSQNIPETEPEVMNVRVKGQDPGGIDISFRLNRAAASSRIVYYNKAYGHTTATLAETGRTENGEMEYHLSLTEQGLYEFQVYAISEDRRENGIGLTLLFTGGEQPHEAIMTYAGNTYFVGRAGGILGGFIELPKAAYYADPESRQLLYAQFVEDGEYYVSADGITVTGWQDIGGKRYYFQADGRKARGRYRVDGTEYTFSEDGVLQKP